MQREKEEEPIPLADIWGRLDQVAREQIIELLGQAAYNFVVSPGVVSAEEENGHLSVEEMRGVTAESIEEAR